MKHLIIVISFFLFCFQAITQSTQSINIIPYPTVIVLKSDSFSITKNTIIYLKKDDGLLKKNAVFLNDFLQKNIGITLAIRPYNPSATSNSITLSLEKSNNYNKESYKLSITKSGINITSNTAQGNFYAIQSLLQLLPNGKTVKTITLPQLSISDQPRFTYRGMHLDVSRHFFTVQEVKKYIDLLALHKFNTFHWHLTDDQGWRIEIKKYPALTKIGSCRAQTLVGNYGSNTYDGTSYCGYYTQAQIKEIVQYATDRYITVIPEIEMPGHAIAALASYPYLGCTKGPYKPMETWGVADDVFCAGNDSTYTFLQNVIDEIIPLFPAKYIHIGGDECPKERWKNCPFCQQKIKLHNLKDEHELQSYFVKKIEQYINTKGKKIIGWNEILEGGLAPNATVMSWQGEAGGIQAAKQGNDVIMTPGSHCYFDHSQSNNEDSITIGSYLPLQKVYSYEPIPAVLTAKEATHILGAQANLWTEYITNISKLEYMALPRMAALAEVLWSDKKTRNFENFEKRLPFILERYTTLGYNFSKAYFNIKTSLLPTNNNNGIVWKVEKKINATQQLRINKTLRNQVNDEVMYTKENIANIEINKTTLATVSIIDENNNILSSTTQQFIFNKATGKKINLKNNPEAAYAGSGAFTLIDGIQNTKGMAKSAEFIGLLGKDVEATIDFGVPEKITSINLHAFTQTASWIYPPAEGSFEVMMSNDGINFTKPLQSINQTGAKNIIYTCTFSDENNSAKFVKILAKNVGIIPSGKPGAGTAAWLFVDEIEVF